MYFFLLETTKIFQVIFILSDCPNFELTSNSIGKTSYGVPDPVTYAFVNQNFDQCKLFWHHNFDSELKDIKVSC